MRPRYGLVFGLMLAFVPLHPMAGQVIKSAGCAVDLEILALPRCAVVTKGDRHCSTVLPHVLPVGHYLMVDGHTSTGRALYA
jgi:hypothetical protein